MRLLVNILLVFPGISPEEFASFKYELLLFSNEFLINASNLSKLSPLFLLSIISFFYFFLLSLHKFISSCFGAFNCLIVKSKSKFFKYDLFARFISFNNYLVCIFKFLSLIYFTYSLIDYYCY